MTDNLYYDQDGKPLENGVMSWITSFEQNRRIGFTTLPSGTYVSTVWLGLDHRFGAEGPPLIFETMIFGGPLSDYQWRYATKKEAHQGHENAVKEAIEAEHANRLD